MKQFFIVAALSILTTGVLSAQSEPTPPPVPQPQPPQAEGQLPTAKKSIIVVRVHPGFPDRALRFLSAIGRSTSVHVFVGESALDLLKAKCGHSRMALEAEVDRMNSIVGPDLKVIEAGTLVLPACARFEEGVKITPARSTTVKELLRSETGFYGPKTTASFLSANPELRRSANPEQIPAGVEVTLPYRATWTTIELKPEVPFTPTAAVERLRELLRKDIGQDRAAAVLAGTSTPGYILKSIPRGAMLNGGTACTAPQTAAWPFEVDKLLTALERSTIAAKTAGRQIVDARVAILDSAFAEPPSEPFSWSRMATSEDTPAEPAYIGVDAATRGDAPISFPDIENAHHGTMVATLALGGNAFVKADKNQLSKIKVRTSSIVEIVPTSEPVNPRPTRVLETAVMYGLKDAVEHQASIVNMSFEFQSPLSLVERELIEHDRLLVVAAAGNDFGNISEKARWPASFGGSSGDTASRVITVGASDGTAIADFSAHSDSKVDVLAPGCDVPSLGIDLQPRSESGTSFAAPLVTFTAALIRQFGVSNPRDIKQRILVSTDVNPELTGYVWSAGVLNPVKAVELFNDYVEIDGRPSPLLGTIDWNGTDSWVCNNGTRINNLNRVSKVARIRHDQWLVMWKTADGELKPCHADLRSSTLDFVGSDGSQTLLVSQIKDLVARHFRY